MIGVLNMMNLNDVLDSLHNVEFVRFLILCLIIFMVAIRFFISDKRVSKHRAKIDNLEGRIKGLETWCNELYNNYNKKE